jgi:hypothetical protein
VSWQQTGSNTGPKNFRLEYSTDGTSFTVHQAYVVSNDGWNSTATPAASVKSFDLSSITALNDAPTIFFRLTVVDTVAISSANPVATTGTGRVDNFTVTAAPPAGSPIITPGVTSLSGFSTFAGTVSASQSFTVGASDLTAPISLTVTGDYEVSSDDETFGPTATLPITGGTGYVRLSAAAAPGASPGIITLSSTGAANKTIALTGNVANPFVLSLSFSPSFIAENSVTPALGTVSIPLATTTNLTVTLFNENAAAATVPANVTIIAGQLSATFNATPVPDPLSLVTNTATVTASADGFIDGTATLNVTNVDDDPDAVISIVTVGVPILQDFDALGITAAGTISATTGTTTNLKDISSSLKGWYAGKIAGNGDTSTTVTPNAGAANSGGVYSYGAVDAADRALGVLASTSNTMGIGAIFKNNTGSTLTGLTLSMTAEFWRSSTVATNTLTFGYGKMGGAITPDTFLSTSDAGVLPLVAANIVGPAPVTTNGALNGNDSANQAAFANVSIPLALAPGESAFIRWRDFDDAGFDAGLAIDNLSVTGVATPPGDTFASWMSTFNFSGFTNPDLTATGDPDNDGLDNSLENIFGSSPAVFSQGLSAVSTAPGQLKFRHTRNATPASDLTPSYEWSPDLVNWYASGASAGGVTVTFGIPTVEAAGPPELVEVTASITGTAPKVFARIKVVQN